VVIVKSQEALLPIVPTIIEVETSIVYAVKEDDLQLYDRSEAP